MTPTETLYHRTRTDREKVAFFKDRETWTYERLATEVEWLACGLIKSGLRQGDRVALPEKDRFGVIYFGSSLKVCFLERVWRDRRNGRLGDVPIPYAELEQLMCAEMMIVRPLNLVDLCGDNPVKIGIPTDAVRASSHRLGQKWSLAFWLHKQRPHGILYRSRPD